MVVIFSLGTILVHRGELTVGQVVTFVGFAGLLIGRLDQLSYFILGLFGQKPAIDAYFDLLDTTHPLMERPNAIVLPKVEGYVRYERVSFCFTDSTAGVFDIDLEAVPGQTIAVVGQTGSGKTTALGLLQRLRDPHNGRITIDGRDIREIDLTSLRRSIAVVFQDAGLFNRTIEENLRIGRPGATDAEVERAARLAEAHQFIVQKPSGYQYLVGERGASLSGGERQCIAIGRAILKDAPILILDEATSALDVETEGRIKQALDTLRRDRTLHNSAQAVHGRRCRHDFDVARRSHCRARVLPRACQQARQFRRHGERRQLLSPGRGARLWARGTTQALKSIAIACSRGALTGSG